MLFRLRNQVHDNLKVVKIRRDFPKLVVIHNPLHCRKINIRLVAFVRVLVSNFFILHVS